MADDEGERMTIQHNPKTGGRGIEWCDRTVNATGGCLHDCKWEMPDGTIAGCYAKALAENGVAKAAYPQGFEHHYWRPGQLNALRAGAEPELRFVDSMSDLFGIDVPHDHVTRVLEAMYDAPHHAFQSLTKAAPQLLKYLDVLPPNLWVGVSSPPDWFMGKRLSRQQQEKMLRRAMEVLREVRERTGNIVWMSAEPVSWDLAEVIDGDFNHPLDWCVIGAASNGRAYYQPETRHIAGLLSMFDVSETPVFFKGNLRPSFRPAAAAGPWRWREDFPRTYRDGSAIPAVERRLQRARAHGWAGLR